MHEPLAVANHLNDDPASPWYGKIRMANDENDSATINPKRASSRRSGATSFLPIIRFQTRYGMEIAQ